jgi:DNA-binding CsgD family transcriptional regulator
MLGLARVEDFITKIRQVDGMDDLSRIFTEETKALGFEHHTCISLVDLNNPPLDAIQVFRFPEAWVEYYIREEYYKYDVVIKTVLKNTGPYLWKALDVSDKRNRQIFAEAKEAGIRDGLTIPIALPGNYPCSINMAGDHTDVDPLSYHVVHLMAEYYLLRIVELSKSNRRLFDPPDLTPRELECLVWMAKGKSDGEIGDILSISHRTVNGYIENIRKKMDVGTRTQAVALAIVCGLIAP